MNNLLLNFLFVQIRGYVYRHFRKSILNRLYLIVGKAEIRLPLDWPWEFNFSVGTTNVCNARCTFCIYPTLVDNAKLMPGKISDDLFIKVVDEWAAGGGKKMHFCSAVGDPLVDPSLGDRICYAKSKGVLSTVITNGILLAQRNNVSQILNADTIFISTQGTSKELYQQVYGVDRYDVFMNGLELLLAKHREAKSKTKITIGFRNKQSVWSILTSRDYKTRIRPYLSRYVSCDFLPMYDTWAGQITEKDCPGPVNKVTHHRAVCQGARTLAIKHDGKVHGCGCLFLADNQDDLLMGNLNEQSLKEIATGDKMKAFHESFLSGNLKQTCAKCSNYTPIH